MFKIIGHIDTIVTNTLNRLCETGTTGNATLDIVLTVIASLFCFGCLIVLAGSWAKPQSAYDIIDKL